MDLNPLSIQDLKTLGKASWSSHVNRAVIIHQFDGRQILQQLNKFSF
jgi:hypothetical protein